MGHLSSIGSLSIAAAFLASCGGDATSPRDRPPFAVVAGANVTDTIAATLAQALVVEVRNDHGDPRSGVVVRFDALPTSDTTRRTESAILVARLAASTFGTFTSDTTDASGRAKALIRLGTVAGDARVLVTVPELGSRDTARFTVAPGAAAKLLVPTRDTAVFAGGTLVLNIAIGDRFNNRRTGTIEFSAGPAIASVDATGRATAGATPGRGFVALRAGTTVDTVRVSVVPRGTLVVVFNANVFPTATAISTVELDGSGYKVLTPGAGGEFFPKWGPAGDRVIYHEGDQFGVQHIYTVDLAGKKQPLIPTSAGMLIDLFGRFTRDGNWVYFSGRRSSDPNVTLFRIHPDGTGFEPERPLGAETDVAWRSSVSPDGSKLVYVAGGTIIRVMDTFTRVVTNLNVGGQFPQWSPDGQFIGYIDQFGGRLRIMRANGTEQRAITLLATYAESAGYDFSSDGKWIVVRGASALDLINVADGSIIPLPYSRNYYQPAFKQ